MASAQTDRLRLLLTSLRSTFSGMLRRTTIQAVELANLAFCQCPPSSDLDPEIRISNLSRLSIDFTSPFMSRSRSIIGGQNKPAFLSCEGIIIEGTV